MSRHMANVVCFVIVLMTSRHVTGQEHDVAQLNKRLTFIKMSVDRDISDIRFQIFELKMTVEQMVVYQRNASDGSIIGGPFPDYGQGMTGVNQKEITDLKNKLKEHENRLNRLFSTVNKIQEVNSPRKRIAKTDIETNCDDRFDALQKKFEETAAAMMKGYKELKTHVNVKVSLVDQIHNISQSVISKQNTLSARIDLAGAEIIRMDGEVNKLKVNKLVENTERNELINNLKAELLQSNAGVETKCDDSVNALKKTFDETSAVHLAGYKDLETQISVQMKNLSMSLISEQNKLSVRMDQADAKIARLHGGLNTLDGVSRTIKELTTRIDKCCIDCGDPTPDHGTVNTTETTIGTVVKISCNHGYVLSGTSIIKCNADSAWSESSTCNPYDCGSAFPANGVATAPKGTTYQKQATVQCNPGYTLNGSSVIECNATGWNESISCVIQNCGDPTPDHGTINSTATTYGTVVKVACNHGYVLSGTSIIKCNADSTWSESATCNPYDCGSAAPKNGVATAPRGTTYRQQATVQCNPGYTLNGSSVIECNATGWNDSVFCRQQPMSTNGYFVKPIFGSDLEKQIKVGTRVVRGRDWEWDEQDGGGPGTVSRFLSGFETGWVTVKWDKGTENVYRIGSDDKYDLLILADGQ